MIIYTPELHQVTDQKRLLDFIKRYGFATVISSENNSIKHITKIPLLLKLAGDTIYLEGHLAKLNPHWEFMRMQPQVIAMFDGPHGYVSPTLYTDPVKNVPTWNYTTVVASGKVEIIESADWLLQSTLELADKYEKDDSWKNNADMDYATNIAKGIVGLKIQVAKFEGKFKLNINKDEQSKANVIKNFEATNPELASEMKRYL